MPNHVINEITLHGSDEEIQAVLKAVQKDSLGIGTIDFNKLLPMPPELNIEAGSRTDRGLKHYRDFVEVFTLGGTVNTEKLASIPKKSEAAFLRQRSDIPPDEWELGKAAWNNNRRFGAPTWYEWCIGHWGTKWNAYGMEKSAFSEDDRCIRFQTAQSAPHPILNELSKRFPDVEIEHQWADEDLGCNCGRRVYRSGGCIEAYYPEGNLVGVRFAADLWGLDLEAEGIVPNKSGTAYISLCERNFEAIELCGKPALFSNDRLTDEDIPSGLFCYHLRHSDSGNRFCTVEPHVSVNHGGSVILREPLDFGEQGYIELTEDSAPNFLGEQQNLLEFIEQGQEEKLSLRGMSI